MYSKTGEKSSEFFFFGCIRVKLLFQVVVFFFLGHYSATKRVNLPLHVVETMTSQLGKGKGCQLYGSQ